MNQFKLPDIFNDIPTAVKVCGGVTLCIGVSVIVHSKIQDYKEIKKLDIARSKRQAERATVLTKLRTEFPLTPEFHNILQLSFDSLRSKLQSRELSAVTVLSAFIAKSLEAHDEVNCITEYDPQALKRAAELDNLNNIKGPFHGIPFCVKDDTDLQGMDTTVGCSKKLNKPADESAVLVQILTDLGAVPFCKTNLPQTCCSSASANPIYGRTLNALNKKLSPGGSSSGTGALVAAGGALFGTGSDTGGSLRIPAHFNGISSLRPTSDRLSRKGLSQCLRNSIGVPSVGFVLTSYPRELVQIFKAITDSNLHYEYDSKVVPIPWNESLFTSDKPLRIGYYTSISGLPCLGDAEETVLRAKTALESLHHTLIPFKMPESARIIRINSSLYFADLGKGLYTDLKHDKIAPIIQGLYDIVSMPLWKRQLLTSIPFLQNRFKHLRIGFATRYSSDLWDVMAERDALINEMLDQMQALNLDLLLGPAFPYPAPGIDDGGGISGEVSYTSIWSLVDFPAGVLRFGTETGKHQNASSKLTHIYGRNKLTIQNAIGMPIGVQLVGKPYFEEVVLRGMVALDNFYQANDA